MKKYLDIRLVKTFSPYSVSKPERDGKRTVGQQLEAISIISFGLQTDLLAPDFVTKSVT